MVDTQMQQRFAAARDKVITLETRARKGIGTEDEKTVHAVVKNMLEPREEYQEVPIGSYIADICRDDQVIEVQTANWGYLRDKLKAFLSDYHVTCVYPIPCRKWIIWINPETGEMEQKNKGRQKGSFYQAFRELYRIRPFLTDPALSVQLLLIDMEEYRIRDGYSKDRRHGSHRFDRIPLALEDSLRLDKPADYQYFLPAALPETFTSKDLADCVGLHYKSISYSQVLQILLEVGVVTRMGKKGQAYLYRRT